MCKLFHKISCNINEIKDMKKSKENFMSIVKYQQNIPFKLQLVPRAKSIIETTYELHVFIFQTYMTYAT